MSFFRVRCAAKTNGTVSWTTTSSSIRAVLASSDDGRGVYRTLSSHGCGDTASCALNDLVRSREGYLLARYASRLLSRSPIVHSDGPISVEGSFTTNELHEMACQAGLNAAPAVTRRCWPARMLLEWSKPCNPVRHTVDFRCGGNSLGCRRDRGRRGGFGGVA